MSVTWRRDWASGRRCQRSGRLTSQTPPFLTSASLFWTLFEKRFFNSTAAIMDTQFLLWAALQKQLSWRIIGPSNRSYLLDAHSLFPYPVHWWSTAAGTVQTDRHVWSVGHSFRSPWFYHSPRQPLRQPSGANEHRGSPELLSTRNDIITP